MYIKGEIVLNDNSLERLQLYLARDKIFEILGTNKEVEISDKAKARFKRMRITGK